MRWIFVVLIFFYLFPIFPVFLPLPTDRVIQVISILYILLKPISFIKFIQNKNLLKFLGATFVLTLVTLLLQLFFAEKLDFSVLKDIINVIGYTISGFFIIHLMNSRIKNFTLIKLFDYIIIVFLLQAIISFIFFFVPSTFDIYTSILNVDVNEGLFMRSGLLHTRLLGVGNAFFNGVIKYGVALIILSFLPYLNGSYFNSRKIQYYASYAIIALAGLLTGRTFFMAIAISLMIFVFFENRNPIKFLFRLILLPAALVVSYFIVMEVFKNLIDQSRLTNITNFVFELFINYSEEGSLSTSSSDTTLDMFIFPDNLKTWLVGDGVFINEDGSYYKRIDVGFLRYIYYFGLIGTLLFFATQFRYMMIVLRMNFNKSLRYLFLILFVWIILLNLKGIAYLDQFWTLFLISMILPKKEWVIQTK